MTKTNMDLSELLAKHDQGDAQSSFAIHYSVFGTKATTTKTVNP